MYSYAEKYDNHKIELREKYRNVEEEAKYSFEPNINQNSARIAKGMEQSFSDRILDQYVSKHQRIDKDSEQVDFEKSRRECTFQPSVNSALPDGYNKAQAPQNPSSYLKKVLTFEELQQKNA